MEYRPMTFTDYTAILRRRKWSLILPLVLIFSVSVVVARVLPSVYKATSTILIEEQEIPDDFVMATVTSFAEQRLQTIYQRVVSFSVLLDMINQFNLYPELKGKQTTEEIVAKMRDDIDMEPISSEIADRRTGRASTATIAFTLSYKGKNPETVQRVANQIASLFLEENLRVREKQATETSEFLEKEMEKVKTRLNEIKAEMAEFKSAHMNELPGLLQVNMQSLNNADNAVDRLNEQIRMLKERESYLETQLASVPHTIEGEMKEKNRLAELRVQLVHLKTRFSDQYPDVLKIKSEIAELEAKVKDNATQNGPGGLRDQLPDNPAFITLSSQLSSTQSEITSIRRQIEETRKTADIYRNRIAQTPKVEETYNAILAELNNTQAKYNDLMQKHMEAKVAQGLEQDQKGERFTLIDPARLPEKAFKPNRLAIILIGLVLGVGAGVGWAAIREATNFSIWGADSLIRATSFPVLGSIPEIVTEKELRMKKVKQLSMAFAVLLLFVGGMAIFHYYVMDLNVFWAKVVRRLGV